MNTIPSYFYYERRKKVFEKLNEGEAIILYSGVESFLGGTTSVPNSNFYYLTGIREPYCIMIMGKRNGNEVEYIFIEEDDKVMAKWIGHRPSKSSIIDISSINNVFYLKDFYLSSSNFLYGFNTLYMEISLPNRSGLPSYNKVFIDHIKNLLPHISVKDVNNIMGEIRMVKDKYEIKFIKKAIEITKESFIETVPYIRSGENERTIQAYIECGFKKRFADIAFNTIVASGPNGPVLHYTFNDRKIKSNEFVLIDFGAKWNMYCADISRTVPVSGKYSRKMLYFYKKILNVQKEVMDLVKPGITIKELQDETVKRIKKIVSESKYIKGDVFDYYYHNIGHHLGIDVHDLSIRTKPLEKNMVITIEPGIYISELGIGIRIEDDVLVTDKGYKNLSHDIPKEVDDIKNLF